MMGRMPLFDGAKASLRLHASGPNGEIWLSWQSFRNGNSDIFVRRLQQGKWSNEVAVAYSDANEWEPSISIDADGTAWVGYDS